MHSFVEMWIFFRCLGRQKLELHSARTGFMFSQSSLKTNRIAHLVWIQATNGADQWRLVKVQRSTLSGQKRNKADSNGFRVTLNLTLKQKSITGMWILTLNVFLLQSFPQSTDNMQIQLRNNSLPLLLQVGAYLLRPDIHKQLLQQHGYSDNVGDAVDEVTVRLFAAQHPAPLTPNHTQPLYRNQLLSPVAIFSLIALLQTFIGQSSGPTRHVRREMLRQVGLDKFRQRVDVLHEQLVDQLTASPPNSTKIKNRNATLSRTVHSLHLRPLSLITNVQLHQELPFNRSLLQHWNRTAYPIVQIRLLNFTHSDDRMRTSINNQLRHASRGASLQYLMDPLPKAARFTVQQWTQLVDDWAQPFNALRTHRRLFHNLDGSQRSTLFVEMRGYLHLHSPPSLAGVHVLRLPYSSPAYSLYLFGGVDPLGQSAPDLHERLRTLNASEWRRVLHDTRHRPPVYAQVRLPRFRLDSGPMEMHSWMSHNMDIWHPFHCEYVNFRGLLNDSRPLCLHDWAHWARLSLNELGSGRMDSADFFGDQPQAPGILQQITFDRPFVVLLRNEMLKLTILIGSLNRLWKANCVDLRKRYMSFYETRTCHLLPS